MPPKRTEPDSASWLPLGPEFRKRSRAEAIYRGHIRTLARLCGGSLAAEGQLEIDRARQTSLKGAYALRSKDRERLIASVHVVTDLVAQGWEVRSKGGSAEVRRPSRGDRGPLEEKNRVRLQLLAERDAQLRQPAVRRFIERLEWPRVVGGRTVSVFNLMRDGRDLASRLSQIVSCHHGNARDSELATVIRPYMQLVEGDGRCCFTGLLLRDIWRYFRHTWSNAYNTVPGRTMMLLIRDAAAEDHPVVGLAALSSPPVQIGERDVWIGWDPSQFMGNIEEKPTQRVASWLARTADEAIAEIATSDLVRDKLISTAELRAPTSETCCRLRDESVRARTRHHTLMGGNDYKKVLQDKQRDWAAIAQMQLFRSKRCLRLAEMLEARIVFREHFGGRPSTEGLRRLTASGRGRAAIKQILRKAKADRVGTLMADISVCGAIAPYNHILGGKLVAMLVASPDTVRAYRQRYADSPSVIASSMAGNAIIRGASLALLTTSSLYAAGASQYNRITIPGAVFGKDNVLPVSYERVAITGGYGSGQFGPATVEALTSFLEQVAGYSRVNSVFGEGVNPRMRKVREALDQLNFPSDELLRHGSQRLVYAVSLVSNLREYLLGIDARPSYRFDARRSGTEVITNWWIRRWLSARIERPGVLEAVESHTLVRPITHGARVPRCDEES